MYTGRSEKGYPYLDTPSPMPPTVIEVNIPIRTSLSVVPRLPGFSRRLLLVQLQKRFNGGTTFLTVDGVPRLRAALLQFYKVRMRAATI